MDIPLVAQDPPAGPVAGRDEESGKSCHGYSILR
ncbi:hypothetical protein CEXT_722131, partial [Caerostris extrusa]